MTLPTAGFRPIFERFGAAYHLDPRLLEAVAMTESSGNPKAAHEEWREGLDGRRYLWDTSRGLMQVLERTARALGFPEATEDYDRLFVPEVCVRYGTKLLCQTLDGFTKSDHSRVQGMYQRLEMPLLFPVRVTLARYNGGNRGNPRKDGSLRNHEYVARVGHWFSEVVKEVP